MTADMLAFNDFYKSAATANGGEFVDIWNGFVDENGNFITTGPDINGQVVRLRGSDGINLTRAGRRKVAFYAEKPLKKLLGRAADPNIGTLTPEMQNRRIIESVFAGIGVTPNIVFETNAYTVSLMQVETGFAATIVPEILVDKMPPIAKTACLHLHEPDITRSIGVIFADRKPRPPVVRALEEVLGAVS